MSKSSHASGARGVPALPPVPDADAPTFTLRQHFVLNRIAEAHGTTALDVRRLPSPAAPSRTSERLAPGDATQR